MRHWGIKKENSRLPVGPDAKFCLKRICYFSGTTKKDFEVFLREQNPSTASGSSESYPVPTQAHIPTRSDGRWWTPPPRKYGGQMMEMEKNLMKVKMPISNLSMHLLSVYPLWEYMFLPK